MAALTWDDSGKRLFETGIDRCVLYPLGDGGTYDTGVAWNGVTGVTESPSGAEATALWANNGKYLNLYSVEEFAATLTAYTYPEEFAECDGSAELVKGVRIGQQTRKMFGLSYRTLIGNDTKAQNYGYKLNFIYGCMAAPSERAYATTNDSPEALEFSWEISTTPVNVDGFLATAKLTIDSTTADPTKLAELEKILYGSSDGDGPRLPLPNEMKTLMAAA